MVTIAVLGIDLGKNVCSLVGLDEAGKAILRRRLKREGLSTFAERLSPCVVAMEACCGAHWLGRIFAARGHEVRLMSPEYVRPYVKAQKNDDRDAEAIAAAIKGCVIPLSRSAHAPNSQIQLDLPEESLMLTGDENIADVKFVVIWQIDPIHPEDYAFNISNQRDTVKAVAESAMREVIGRGQIQRILTADRPKIESDVQGLMQGVLNGYRAGILVLQVQLQSVDPPEQVIAAFKDVTAAQQDQNRLRNEAEAYANRVVPEARGKAAAIVQEAEGLPASNRRPGNRPGFPLQPWTRSFSTKAADRARGSFPICLLGP